MHGEILTKEYLINCHSLGMSSSDISKETGINARTVRWYMKKHNSPVLEGKSKVAWNKGLKAENDARILKSITAAHAAARGKAPWNKGKKLPPIPDEQKEKISKALKGRFVGALSNSWRGGVTPKNKIIRRSREYKEWREKVFQRDNYTCQLCLVRGGELHPDHIKQFAYYPELRFCVDNGRTLCVDCHRKTPTWGKKEKALNSW